MTESLAENFPIMRSLSSNFSKDGSKNIPEEPVAGIRTEIHPKRVKTERILSTRHCKHRKIIVWGLTTEVTTQQFEKSMYFYYDDGSGGEGVQGV
jgi:hypothetical protein